VLDGQENDSFTVAKLPRSKKIGKLLGTVNSTEPSARSPIVSSTDGGGDSGGRVHKRGALL
jgi:hypothetical protein